MATTFPLQIVSPAKLVFSGEATMVEVPGTEGDVGVLPGHAPFFTMIRPGIITIHKDGGKQRLFAAAGYADVSPEGTIILSDDVRDLANLTLEDALAAVERATEAAAAAETDADRNRAARQRDAAEALTLALKQAA